MLFGSYWFYVFAVIVVGFYWLLPWTIARLYFLLVASVVFQFHFAGAIGVAIILVLAVMVYIVGRLRKPLLIKAAMVICISALVVFKYSHFISLGIVYAMVPAWGVACERLAQQWLPVVPPLAISFFTFEFIHYLYDIQGKAEPIRRPIDFALFIFFFPTLVAGPIKRFEQFVPQLSRGPSQFVLEDLAWGLLRVGVGFFKKLVIADNLTAAIQYFDKQLIICDFSTRWLLFLFLGFSHLYGFQRI